MLPERGKRSSETSVLCPSMICTRSLLSLQRVAQEGRKGRNGLTALSLSCSIMMFRLSGGLTEGSGRGRETKALGAFCVLHRSAFHSSPGLSEHSPWGPSAPLAGEDGCGTLQCGSSEMLSLWVSCRWVDLHPVGMSSVHRLCHCLRALHRRNHDQR